MVERKIIILVLTLKVRKGKLAKERKGENAKGNSILALISVREKKGTSVRKDKG